MTTDGTLRDHARGAIRDEVSRHAWLLFADHGFEATTVDQIAAAAGMSRRTFFRYFAGKDELVLDRLVEAGHEVADALRSRPADEAAWPALRSAFDEVVRPQEQHATHARQLQLMLGSEPALRAAVVERQRRWQALLAPLVAERLPRRTRRRGPDVRAEAVTATALACLQVAETAWATHPGCRLAAVLDEAMAAAGPVDD